MYATITHDKSTCTPGRFNRIEARASRVTEDKAGPPFSAKGETAEGVLPGPGQGSWYDAEDAAYCHDTWSAILCCWFQPVWLFICMIYTTNAFSVRDCRLWCF